MSVGGSGDMVLPSLVVAPDHSAHIAFVEGSVTHTSQTPVQFGKNLIRYTSNATGTFVSPMTVDARNVGAFTSLALDSSSTLHLAYAGADVSNGTGCLRRSQRPIGGLWQESADDSGGCSVAQVYPASAVGPDGTLHIVYEEAGDIYYRHGDPATDVWSAPVDISNSSSYDATPTIAVASDGRVHIAFNRWLSVQRRALCYVVGSDLQFAPPVELRTTSGAVTSLDEIYSWPPFAPSIAVDASGACHLTFTAVFGTNPQESSRVYYMTDADGDWSSPESITPLGTYNRTALAVGPDGALHVAAESRGRESGDWDIVYIEKGEGVWSQPENLTELNSADDFLASSGGRALAVRDSVAAIVYYTSEWRDGLAGHDIGLLIRGTTGGAASPSFYAESSVVDFGTVRFDTCRSVSVALGNHGGGTLDIGPPTILEDPGHFTIVAPFDSLHLGPGDEDSMIVRFCPLDTNCFEARIQFPTNIGSRYIVLRGCGGAPLIEVDTLDLDFGSVRLGASEDRSYVVRNRGTFPLHITRETISNSSFGFAAPRPPTFSLDPGQSQQVTVRYRPLAIDDEEDWVVVEGNAYNTIPLIRVHGSGVFLSDHMLWLDTALTDVGRPVDLKLQIDPPIAAHETVTAFSLWLRFDSLALYLHDPLPDADITRTYLDGGRVLIETTPGWSPDESNALLARLRFEGLGTGSFRNSVRIDSIRFTGSVSVGDRRDGEIFLKGCDVDRNVLFGRSIVMRSISPNPITDDAEIVYQAPVGVVPRLVFLDLMGREVYTVNLPIGTDAEQTARVPVQGLVPGFYLAELRDRAERSVVPVVIAQ